MEMDLRNKTTSEFRTLFPSPLDVPNSQVSLYLVMANMHDSISQKDREVPVPCSFASMPLMTTKIELCIPVSVLYVF